MARSRPWTWGSASQEERAFVQIVRKRIGELSGAIRTPYAGRFLEGIEFGAFNVAIRISMGYAEAFNTGCVTSMEGSRGRSPSQAIQPPGG